MTPLFIPITMDVDPVKLDANRTGPDDEKTSGRFILAYRDLAGRHGSPVSYLIHPEAAMLHAGLFRDLEQEGHCPGIHPHPTRFRHVAGDLSFANIPLGSTLPNEVAM